MAKYAEGTKVPVQKSRAEIEQTLARFGADSFGYMSQPEKAMIAFRCKDRNVRFDLPLPNRERARSQEQFERNLRERWRALGLCIKAKLASESGIETFEEAFLSHVVMPDGQTVGEHAAPRIAQSYENKQSVPLLPGPNREK